MFDRSLATKCPAALYSGRTGRVETLLEE